MREAVFSQKNADRLNRLVCLADAEVGSLKLEPQDWCPARGEQLGHPRPFYVCRFMRVNRRVRAHARVCIPEVAVVVVEAVVEAIVVVVRG